MEAATSYSNSVTHSSRHCKQEEVSSPEAEAYNCMEQSVWNDESKFPADIFRLVIHKLNDLCQEWPDRASIVAAMGVCKYWRRVVNATILEVDGNRKQSLQYNSQNNLISQSRNFNTRVWLCHPRRLTMPAPLLPDHLHVSNFGNLQGKGASNNILQLSRADNRDVGSDFQPRINETARILVEKDSRRSHMLQCVIERSGFGRFRQYKMYMSISDERSKTPGKLLLVARRRHYASLFGSSSFSIEFAGGAGNCRKMNRFRQSEKIVKGYQVSSPRVTHQRLQEYTTANNLSSWFSLKNLRTRSNFLGTYFMIESGMVQPSQQIGLFSRSIGDAHTRNSEVKWNGSGTVKYDINIGGLLGPRKMRACLPLTAGTYLPINKYSNQEVINLRSKSPTWHQELQCWCLDFNGRVTEASVKNFQLVEDNGKETDDDGLVIMQFGKIGENLFTCDFRHPLSCQQAFAIAMTSLDSKLGCE